MFDGYSLKNCLPSNTVQIKKPLESNEHHYSIGNPKWQQTYTTCSRMYYTEKDLRNNTYELNKPYLFPNHSDIEIGPYSSKNIYQSSNKNDYHLPEMTPYEKDQFQKNFIVKKDDGLGKENDKESMYSLKMKNPKEQEQNFDYDQINFKYNEYANDTLTQQQKPKDPNTCWGFEYYNRDKNKHHINVPFMYDSINNNIDKKSRKKKYKNEKKQVWDPIANRFFECSA